MRVGLELANGGEVMTCLLGKCIARDVILAALDFTADECYKAAKANPRDQYLVGYVDGIDRAGAIVRSLLTLPRCAEARCVLYAAVPAPDEEPSRD